jgi:hypothetical protein
MWRIVMSKGLSSIRQFIFGGRINVVIQQHDLSASIGVGYCDAALRAINNCVLRKDVEQLCQFVGFCRHRGNLQPQYFHICMETSEQYETNKKRISYQLKNVS